MKARVVLGVWVLATALFSAMQARENRQPDGVHAPVWWIALTWPFWLVVVSLDLRVRLPHFKAGAASAAPPAPPGGPRPR